MRWVFVGLLVGWGMFGWSVLKMPSAYAVRLSKPPTITKLDEANLAELNSWLDKLWQLTNGRYTVDVVTTNPNGVRTCAQGDEVYFNTSGSFQHCVCSSATTPATPTGKTWRCSSAYTAP